MDLCWLLPEVSEARVTIVPENVTEGAENHLIGQRTDIPLSFIPTVRGLYVPSWFLPRRRSKAEEEESTGWLPSSPQGASPPQCLPCAGLWELLHALHSALKATKSGESGREFSLSHACARPQRGHRLTGQVDGSSCT